jgi:hypothetical protein
MNKIVVFYFSKRETGPKLPATPVPIVKKNHLNLRPFFSLQILFSVQLRDNLHPMLENF